MHSNQSGDGREEPAVSWNRRLPLAITYWLLAPVGLGVAGKLSNKQFAKHVAILRN